MNPSDIKDLAADCDRIIGGLDSHRTRGPLLVTRDGEPEAVVIRHKAYAPRLQDFDVAQDGDVLCKLCPGRVVIVANPYNLGAAVEAANEHWREQHRAKP